MSSVGLIVEGVAGIFHGATIDAERVYLKQRKGFIKIAMQAGVGARLPPTLHDHPTILSPLSQMGQGWDL